MCTLLLSQCMFDIRMKNAQLIRQWENRGHEGQGNSGGTLVEGGRIPPAQSTGTAAMHPTFTGRLIEEQVRDEDSSGKGVDQSLAPHARHHCFSVSEGVTSTHLGRCGKRDPTAKNDGGEQQDLEVAELRWTAAHDCPLCNRKMRGRGARRLSAW